ncbi:hypothetical protein ACB092_06G275700 [Castanea dentata]
MDGTAQWPKGQGVGLVKPLEGVAPSTRPMLERRARPQEHLNCPRCNSTNTKFCYYNNYSLTQPRYFCKTCRRYWTEGGSLRNVPVGGGSRKNRKSSATATATASTSSKIPDLNPPNLSQFSSQNPKAHEGQDLNLGFPAFQKYHDVSQYVQVPKIENNNSNHHNSGSASSTHLSALELLRTGMASRGLNTFIPPSMPDSTTLYSSSGFPFHEFKPTHGFSIDGLGSRYGAQENGGKLLFPFEELKQISSTNQQVEQNKGQGGPSGYWSSMLNGGGPW